ncbi:MAG: cytochrome c [Proteobacteria bacterium]|nr:cytochrome c [Pseudomonadota bacterium]
MRYLPALLLTLSLPAVADEQSGAEVYNTTCIECHGSGKHKAPLFGSAKHWGKLVREGLDDLVPAALGGLRKMPAKGGNPALTDGEVARAVIHMANAGGGSFAEPTPADIERWRAKADKRKRK